MTLLRRTTSATEADDSLSRLESDDDIQTDSGMHSLHSLGKEFRSLTISAGDSKLGESNLSVSQQCESGIFSDSYHSGDMSPLDKSKCEAETAHLRRGTFEKDQRGEDNGLTRVMAEEDCGPASTGTVVEGYPSEYVEEEKEDVNEKDDKKTGWVRWDEMCEDFPDKDGDTILHLAVLHAMAHLTEVVKLLGLQDQVNWRNRLYQTPLHLAALTSNTNALLALFRLGASLHLQDCHGNTPLHSVCQRNDAQTFTAMLEADWLSGNDDDNNVDNIMQGVGCGTPNCNHLDEGRCDKTLCQREDFSPRGDTYNNSWKGVVNEGREVPRKIREVSAALRTRNYEGVTCLHLAVMHGNLDLVKMLLRYGADINAKDGKSGRTSLHFAVDSPEPSSSIIRTLLQHPDLLINAPNFAKQTALQLARGRNHHDLVDLLHLHGADWFDSIHGYHSSDSFSDEEMEEDFRVPYDDICVAGQPVVHGWRR